MEAGNVVEFIDSQKIICAVVMEIKKLRLRLLTENSREVKISASRLSHRSRQHLDLGLGRVKLTDTLKQIALRRRALTEAIDIRELWEVLNSEQEWIDVATMTDFCFPDTPDDDHTAAVVRAFFGNRLYFKFNSDRFFPYSEEKVAQMAAQQKETRRREQIIKEGGVWLKTCLKSNVATPPTPPAEEQKIVEILRSYYLYERESPHHVLGKAIVKGAGLDSSKAIFQFLVKIGVWHEDENVDLMRFGVSTRFSDQVALEADKLATVPNQIPLVKGRRDLTDLDIMTIDGQSTLDFDDAISIEPDGHNYRVGIHIADVGHYIKPGDSIDCEAMARGSSIYMPDRKISMVPSVLSDDLCSLKVGELRAAITTMITITPGAKVLGFEIYPSLISVKRQLTYHDVNLIAEEDEKIKALHGIAQAFRQVRLDQRAIQLDLPEINIWINEKGRPEITRINRESPGRMLVAEMMILANWLAAKYLCDNEIPAIYRSQPDPKERVLGKNKNSLYQNWMQRKLLSRFMLGSAPEHHSGLGLDAYVTATSPIRKYFDLVTQRQIRSVLGLGAPYSREEIDKIIQCLEQPMLHVGRIQFRRNRYWLLKYMEGRIGTKVEALVLGRRRNSFQVLLKEFLIECPLPKPGNIELKPEDLVQITIQHVRARNDVVTIFMG